MITLHIRQNRRQATIQVEEFVVHRWAWADWQGTYKDEWNDTCYRGTTPFAAIAQQLHADPDGEFQIRVFGSRRDSWEDYYRVYWDEKGWYLTNDTTGC